MYLKDALNDRATYSTYECNQHADTYCLGSNFNLMHDTGRRYKVMPYNKAYDPVSNIKIVSGATAYTDPVSNFIFILRIHGALYFGKDTPYHVHESISLLATTANDEELLIPLQFKGVYIILKAELQIQKNWIHAHIYI